MYNNLGEIAIDHKNYNLAIQYLTKSLQLNKEFKVIEGLDENYINLGIVYSKTGNIQEATECYKKGIEFCKQCGDNEHLVEGYHHLAEFYEETGNSNKALEVYKRYMQVNDTILTHKFENQVAQWQSIYELKNKEYQITTSKNELKVKNMIIQKDRILRQFLFAIVGFIILISLLIIINVQHKRIITDKENELQKHKIHELENEKMLLATQAVLKGEENERKRLARDLHDGLGGLLTGTKTAFNYMKGNVILNSETAKDFNHALSLLDTSIGELRRVAHNMMPEALVKLGLRDTLADYCSELSNANDIKMNFQFYGQFERVESDLEINSFRIIQELVNNAIKHSQASELVVQMIQEPHRLCFIVFDNGIGLDLNTIEQTKGIGLASIKSRVASFNGHFEFNSKPSKGTEFTIEFIV